MQASGPRTDRAPRRRPPPILTVREIPCGLEPQERSASHDERTPDCHPDDLGPVGRSSHRFTPRSDRPRRSAPASSGSTRRTSRRSPRCSTIPRPPATWRASRSWPATPAAAGLPRQPRPRRRSSPSSCAGWASRSSIRSPSCWRRSTWCCWRASTAGRTSSRPSRCSRRASRCSSTSRWPARWPTPIAIYELAKEHERPVLLQLVAAFQPGHAGS